MKKLFSLLLALIVFSQLFLYQSMPGDEKKYEQDFKAPQKVKMDLALGSCKIVKSTDKKVHLLVNYTYPDDQFKIIVIDRNNVLKIEEKFLGNDPRGYADWLLYVPKDVEVKFNSGIGNLTAIGINNELSGNSGTGNVTVENSVGDFKLNSGTGRVEVYDSEGEFDLNSGIGKVIIEDSKGEISANSGTGRVYGENIEIDGDGSFNSGTGSVFVKSPKGIDFDLTISSGTGNAELNLKGEPLNGYYEFSTDSKRGTIVSPVKFDDEEKYSNGDSDNIRKWFTKGSGTNRYFIKTGTGRAQLKL